MVTGPGPDAARAALDGVCDPEIPALTIAEIGILRDVAVEDDAVTVTLTPTYSGCPALTVIGMQVRDVLLGAGFGEVRIEMALSPAWTSDWLDDAAREKLRSLGIAPPVGRSDSHDEDPAVACPRCGSVNTSMLSRFGSTACKALYRCSDCLEPFDYFKCI